MAVATMAKSKPQTIFRAKGAGRKFTIISNALLQDPRLSHETKGLICELLSRPVDWEITVQQIWKHGASGRDKVLRMLEEATRLGYVKSDRGRDSDGTLGARYFTVHDEVQPSHDEAQPLPGIQAVEPLPGKPLPGFQKRQNKEYNKIQNLPLRARARELIEDEEGLRGKGFALPWEAIDQAAELRGHPPAQARKLARVLAIEWCHGAPPRAPMATFRRALREEAASAGRDRPPRKPVGRQAAAETIRRLQADTAQCEHGYQTSSCSVCRTGARRRPEAARVVQ